MPGSHRGAKSGVAILLDVPELGQLVLCRDQHWIVSDVAASQLPDDPLAPAGGDLDPRHGFYDTAQGRRSTIHPQVRDELLDRLLKLNHARHAAEVAAGRHTKGAKKKPAKRATPKPTHAEQEGLF